MKNKHKTYEERLTIEQMLSTKKTFKKIGNALGCNCTSISREIKSYYITKKSSTVGKSFNNYAKRKEYMMQDLHN
ncbi:MAG: helix-turn-helix domain-containing protein [Bacilli bacterium]